MWHVLIFGSLKIQMTFYEKGKRFLKECLSQTIFSVLKSQCSNNDSTLSLVLCGNELFQVMYFRSE